MTLAWLLPFAISILPFINWPVAILLLRASRRDPTILALRERAIFALMIAIWITIYVGVMLNTEAGYAVFSFDVGRTIVRIGNLGIGIYPVWWLWSYKTNRF